MKAVIDTNVLVSALISKTPESPTVRILHAITDMRFTPLYAPDIIAEYREVLARPRFHFNQAAVSEIIDRITSFGMMIEVLAGSQINMRKPAGFAAGDDMRKRLQQEGLIVEKRPGVFVLKSKQTFAKPSAASCFVLGGATNGWTEWKNVNGEPLDVMRKK